LDRAGITVLITGALGSVGRTAVFVAKQHGAHVIVGVRAKQKKEAEALSAERVIALDDDEDIASLKDLDPLPTRSADPFRTSSVRSSGRAECSLPSLAKPLRMPTASRSSPCSPSPTPRGSHQAGQKAFPERSC
jgi:hypothetical protein